MFYRYHGVCLLRLFCGTISYYTIYQGLFLWQSKAWLPHNSLDTYLKSVFKG